MKLILKITLLILLALVIALQAYNIFAPSRKSFSVCPVEAISMQGGKAIIDSKKCIGCRRCVDGFAIVPAKPVPVAARDIQIPEPMATEDALAPLSAPKTKATSQTEAKPQAAPHAVKQDKQAYQVDPSFCIGCGLCVDICPTQAITMVDGKAVIDKDKCINCGICKNGNNASYQGCPVNAISAP